MYNDLGGSSIHFLVRNALNTTGYGLYSAIAMRIMIGAGAELKSEGWQWLRMVMLMMFFTQYICDIKDIDGDRLTGKKTVPMAVGDDICRWGIAVPVVVFSVLCPAFFGISGWRTLPALILGGLVASRTLKMRTLEADKLTWKLWALWTCSLFILPMVGNVGEVVDPWQNMVKVICAGMSCSDGLNVAALSWIALVFEGRRILDDGAGGANRTLEVPTINFEGVIA